MQQSQPSALTTLSSYILDALWTLTQALSCFPSTPSLRLNNTPYKILRLLGEGGFSYVYLVQSPGSPTLYALKKIRCPFGAESVALAMREVEAYALFEGVEGVIERLGWEVKDEGDGKTVYLLLPYYGRGNLQDAINANLVHGARFPERKLMGLMLGVCRALRGMHRFRGGEGDGRRAGKKRRTRGAGEGDDEEEEEPLMEGEGDGLASSQDGTPEGRITAYAHRDIKPGNIMISDSGTQPILMDLGSLVPSPTPVTSRAMALQVQDQAAEHSTMPYRAPELFDVQLGASIDTKVDIWSLGCTLYACLVGKSPFEARSEETGGSLSLCVLGGDWRFPDEGPAEAKRGKQRVSDGGEAKKRDDGISEPVREIVRRCLRVEPAERPDVDELIKMVEDCIAVLPEDGEGFGEG